MTDQEQSLRTGLIAGLLAYTMWGFLPVYFIIAEGISATEILAHRIIWSVPFGAMILALRHQWPEVRKALGNFKVLRALGVAAFFIALNWGVYIWAVQQGRIFEASLGYYINPLVFVVIGVVVNHEALSRLQGAAVGLAALGVAVLTFYGGIFPWISIFLALSFTIYGYIRKTADVGAMPGLFIETVLLLLPALLYGIWLVQQGTAAFFDGQLDTVLLLVLAGPVTVLPLLCFAISAKRLTLITIGFLQFIGPTLQFIIGLLNGERFTTAHAWCFGFIWLAVAVFCFDAWQKSRKALRPAAGTV